jgi:hypothetical protein
MKVVAALPSGICVTRHGRFVATRGNIQAKQTASVKWNEVFLPNMQAFFAVQQKCLTFRQMSLF